MNKPKEGDKYYFIEVYKGEVHVQSAEWFNNEHFDFPAMRFGNFFPATPEGRRRASEVTKQIKAIFKNEKRKQNGNRIKD